MSQSYYSHSLDDEYVEMSNEVIKMAVILVVVNVLMFLSNPSKNKLFAESYIKLLVFALLGIMTYWLVIRKIIIFN